VSADRPRTFANPINIDYRFMLDSPSRREAADPVMVLFGDDYYLFASKSGGYWHSKDMVDWTFVTPTGLPIEAYAPAVMAYDGALYYSACNIGLYRSNPKRWLWSTSANRLTWAILTSSPTMTTGSISTTALHNGAISE
jgi:hypothetical protein